MILLLLSVDNNIVFVVQVKDKDRQTPKRGENSRMAAPRSGALGSN